VPQILLLLLLAALAAGCSAPNSKLVQIQQDKEQLLVAIRDQRDKNRQLTDQVASLETRLDQAEKELARAGGGTRISTRPSPSLPTPRGEPLPWRSPADKGKSAPAMGSPKTSGPTLRSASGAVEAVAALDSRIQYDPRRGQAQLDAPVSFDQKTGQLTAESKRELDQVSKLLRSDEAKGLQITVTSAGSPERAQAVADYLDRHGIPQERLSVAAPNGTSPAAFRGIPSSEVRITLAEGEQPLRR
jgi:outer membrane protein OmpA-like peptidoglycan-associated protein